MAVQRISLLPFDSFANFAVVLQGEAQGDDFERERERENDTGDASKDSECVSVVVLAS